MQTTNQLESIPSEVLIRIFKYSTPSPIIHRFTLVCKQWYDIITKTSDVSNALWQFMCFNRWHVWTQLNKILLLGDKLKFERSTKEWFTLLNERSQVIRDAITPLIIKEQPMNDDMFTSINDKIQQLYHFEYLQNNGYDTDVLWLNLFIERALKDIRAVKLLNKTMWNHRLELDVIAECAEMDMDVFEHLLDTYHTTNNLTFKYFAKKVLYRIHTKQVYKEWEELLEHIDDCLMIHGVLLLSKTRNIDLDITEEVWKPLDQIVANIVKRAKDLNVDTTVESEQLFDIVNQELFDVAGFHGDSENYYKLDNCFIDSAIRNKAGIPITLCAIYQYLCLKAFNIHLLPIGAPAHFILKWEKGNRFIDVFNGGIQMTMNRCVENIIEHVPFNANPDEQNILNTYLKHALSNRLVFLRMLANIIGFSTRQYGLMRDEEVIPFLSISLLLDGHNYLHRILRLEKTMNYPDMLDIAIADHDFLAQHINQVGQLYAIDMIWRLLNKVRVIVERTRVQLQEEPDRPEQTRRDSPNDSKVLYKVGQLIRHRKYSYRGVVFGWDRKCLMQEEWIRQMGVTSQQKEKPFYHVLVHFEDRPNQTTYVATDNIQIVSGTDVQEVENEEIGRYFTHLDMEKGMYVPNNLTRYQYPDDYVSSDS
jgi:F-box protein 21